MSTPNKAAQHSASQSPTRKYDLRLRLMVSALLWLLAIPIGLWLLMQGGTVPFSKLRKVTAFCWAWVFSSVIAGGCMSLSEYVTRVLDKQYAWQRKAMTRLFLQLGAGILVPLSLALTAHVALAQLADPARYLPADLNQVFGLGLFLLVLFNGVCCLVLPISKQHARLAFGTDLYLAEPDGRLQLPELPRTAVNTAEEIPEIMLEFLRAHTHHVEVNGHTCKIMLGDGRRRSLRISLDALQAGLDSADFFRIHRKYLIHRKAIADLDINRAQHRNYVLLNAPYKGHRLRIGDTYYQDFIEWLGHVP